MEEISTVDPSVNEDLEKLLECFGSAFSIEVVVSAYRKAGQNSDLAAEILCGFTSNASPLEGTSGLDSPKSVSSQLPSDKDSENVSDGQKQTKERKLKKCSASMGTVSSVIGKDYIKPRAASNEPLEAKKPLKLESKDFPVSLIWSENNTPNVTTVNAASPQAGIEEFLFKMLGDGFQLDMPAIEQVLSHCGYDIQKSIDQLLDLSASALENHEEVGVASQNSTGKSTGNESLSFKEQEECLDSDRSDGGELMSSNLTIVPQRGNDRTGLQKEVLQALFDVPDISEAPKRSRPRRVTVPKSSRVFGKLLTQPPDDDTREHRSSATDQHIVSTEVEDDENSYEVLRAAVKEHWITMREYYKALSFLFYRCLEIPTVEYLLAASRTFQIDMIMAADAYVKGDHAKAHRLLEKGQFFRQRAMEADNKSCEKLVETRTEDVVCVKLHGHEPKESLRLLRLHLTSFSGIPSIKYLRLIMESNNEDTTKEKRKRLIIKQLEKESIKWNEEGNGKAILIQVDVIDPKRLSFAKKHAK